MVPVLLLCEKCVMGFELTKESGVNDDPSIAGICNSWKMYPSAPSTKIAISFQLRKHMPVLANECQSCQAFFFIFVSSSVIGSWQKIRNGEPTVKITTNKSVCFNGDHAIHKR